MDSSDRHALTALLDAVRGCDPSTVDDTELRALLVTAESVRNAAEALQGRAMVEMKHRAYLDDSADLGTSPVPEVPIGAREEFVVDEVALELHCSRVAASHRLATAMTAALMTAVGDAWGAGRIDARKVQIIGDGLVGTEPAFTQTLATAAMEYAATHTGPQLRAWLARRVLREQPHAAEVRRQRATNDRRVSLLPLPDGVAELSAVMPASQARHVYDTLSSLAHAADTGDARTVDQRRSDALLDLVTGRAEPPQVNLNVTVAATVLTGESDQPGHLAGYGPITADGVREVAGGTTRHMQWRRLLTEPVTGVLIDVVEPRYRPSTSLDRAVRERDVTCRFPGCRRPATTARNGVDLDHTIPWPRGATTAANLACLCRHHHRLKHSPGWRVESDLDGTLRWTTPGGREFATQAWQYDDPPSEAESEAA